MKMDGKAAAVAAGQLDDIPDKEYRSTMPPLGSDVPYLLNIPSSEKTKFRRSSKLESVLSRMRERRDNEVSSLHDKPISPRGSQSPGRQFSFDDGRHEAMESNSETKPASSDGSQANRDNWHTGQIVPTSEAQALTVDRIANTSDQESLESAVRHQIREVVRDQMSRDPSPTRMKRINIEAASLLNRASFDDRSNMRTSFDDRSNVEGSYHRSHAYQSQASNSGSSKGSFEIHDGSNGRSFRSTSNPSSTSHSRPSEYLLRSKGTGSYKDRTIQSSSRPAMNGESFVDLSGENGDVTYPFHSQRAEDPRSEHIELHTITEILDYKDIEAREQNTAQRQSRNPGLDGKQESGFGIREPAVSPRADNFSATPIDAEAKNEMGRGNEFNSNSLRRRVEDDIIAYSSNESDNEALEKIFHEKDGYLVDDINRDWAYGAARNSSEGGERQSSHARGRFSSPSLRQNQNEPLPDSSETKAVQERIAKAVQATIDSAIRFKNTTSINTAKPKTSLRRASPSPKRPQRRPDIETVPQSSMESVSTESSRPIETKYSADSESIMKDAYVSRKAFIKKGGIGSRPAHSGKMNRTKKTDDRRESDATCGVEDIFLWNQDCIKGSRKSYRRDDRMARHKSSEPFGSEDERSVHTRFLQGDGECGGLLSFLAATRKDVEDLIGRNDGYEKKTRGSAVRDEILTLNEALAALKKDGTEYWDGISTLCSTTGNSRAAEGEKLMATYPMRPRPIPIEITTLDERREASHRTSNRQSEREDFLPSAIQTVGETDVTLDASQSQEQTVTTSSVAAATVDAAFDANVIDTAIDNILEVTNVVVDGADDLDGTRPQTGVDEHTSGSDQRVDANDTNRSEADEAIQDAAIEENKSPVDGVIESVLSANTDCAVHPKSRATNGLKADTDDGSTPAITTASDADSTKDAKSDKPDPIVQIKSSSITDIQSDYAIDVKPDSAAAKPDRAVDVKSDSKIDVKSHSAVDGRPDCKIAGNSDTSVNNKSNSAIVDKPDSTTVANSNSAIENKSDSAVERKPNSTSDAESDAAVDKQLGRGVEDQPESVVNRDGASSIDGNGNISYEANKSIPVESKNDSTLAANEKARSNTETTPDPDSNVASVSPSATLGDGSASRVISNSDAIAGINADSEANAGTTAETLDATSVSKPSVTVRSDPVTTLDIGTNIKANIDANENVDLYVDLAISSDSEEQSLVKSSQPRPIVANRFEKLQTLLGDDMSSASLSYSLATIEEVEQGPRGSYLNIASREKQIEVTCSPRSEKNEMNSDLPVQSTIIAPDDKTGTRGNQDQSDKSFTKEMEGTSGRNDDGDNHEEHENEVEKVITDGTNDKIEDHEKRETKVPQVGKIVRSAAIDRVISGLVAKFEGSRVQASGLKETERTSLNAAAKSSPRNVSGKQSVASEDSKALLLTVTRSEVDDLEVALSMSGSTLDIMNPQEAKNLKGGKQSQKNRDDPQPVLSHKEELFAKIKAFQERKRSLPSASASGDPEAAAIQVSSGEATFVSTSPSVVSGAKSSINGWSIPSGNSGSQRSRHSVSPKASFPVTGKKIAQSYLEAISKKQSGVAHDYIIAVSKKQSQAGRTFSRPREMQNEEKTTNHKSDRTLSKQERSKAGMKDGSLSDFEQRRLSLGQKLHKEISDKCAALTRGETVAAKGGEPSKVQSSAAWLQAALFDDAATAPSLFSDGMTASTSLQPQKSGREQSLADSNGVKRFQQPPHSDTNDNGVSGEISQTVSPQISSDDRAVSARSDRTGSKIFSSNEDNLRSVTEHAVTENTDQSPKSKNSISGNIPPSVSFTNTRTIKAAAMVEKAPAQSIKGKPSISGGYGLVVNRPGVPLEIGIGNTRGSVDPSLHGDERAVITTQQPQLDSNHDTKGLVSPVSNDSLEVGDLVSKIDHVIHRLIQSGKLDMSRAGNEDSNPHQNTMRNNTEELLQNLEIIRAHRGKSQHEHALEMANNDVQQNIPQQKADSGLIVSAPATRTSGDVHGNVMIHRAQQRERGSKNLQQTRRSSPSPETLVSAQVMTGSQTMTLYPVEGDVKVQRTATSPVSGLAADGKKAEGSNIALLRARRDQAAKKIQNQTQKMAEKSAMQAKEHAQRVQKQPGPIQSQKQQPQQRQNHQQRLQQQQKIQQNGDQYEQQRMERQYEQQQRLSKQEDITHEVRPQKRGPQPEEQIKRLHFPQKEPPQQLLHQRHSLQDQQNPKLKQHKRNQQQPIEQEIHQQSPRHQNMRQQQNLSHQKLQSPQMQQRRNDQSQNETQRQLVLQETSGRPQYVKTVRRQHEQHDRLPRKIISRVGVEHGQPQGSLKANEASIPNLRPALKSWQVETQKVDDSSQPRREGYQMDVTQPHIERDDSAQTNPKKSRDSGHELELRDQPENSEFGFAQHRPTRRNGPPKPESLGAKRQLSRSAEINTSMYSERTSSTAKPGDKIHLESRRPESRASTPRVSNVPGSERSKREAEPNFRGWEQAELRKLPMLLTSTTSTSHHLDLSDSSYETFSSSDEDTDFESDDDTQRLERIESMIYELRARRSSAKE